GDPGVYQSFAISFINLENSTGCCSVTKSPLTLYVEVTRRIGAGSARGRLEDFGFVSESKHRHGGLKGEREFFRLLEGVVDV
ncbi:hypothetical protein KUCAC02_020456, partial [Chaenocephalus aceratus]